MLKIYILHPERHAALLPFFVTLHIDVINTDGTSATFVPPLDSSKMLTWWQSQAQEAAQDKRIIIFCVDVDENNLSTRMTSSRELAGRSSRAM